MNYAGTPSFCAIAPIDYSHLVAGRSAHLVLAHLIDKEYQPESKWDQVDTYIDFIRNEKANGAFIMFDNGAYELHKSYEPDRLLDLASMVSADAIVLPDYPFRQSQVTIDAAKLYAPIFKENGFKTFFVPQSERNDADDWVAAYDWAANGEDNELIDIIGISILGVPVAFGHLEPSYARVVAMEILKSRSIYNPNKHHHFLGLNAGPALEIPTLIRMGVLDTVDSSGPVWAGIQGHRYTPDADSFQAVKKLTSPVDFHLPFTKDARTIERIQYNMNITDSLFAPGAANTTAPWYAVE